MAVGTTIFAVIPPMTKAARAIIIAILLSFSFLPGSFTMSCMDITNIMSAIDTATRYGYENIPIRNGKGEMRMASIMLPEATFEVVEAPWTFGNVVLPTSHLMSSTSLMISREKFDRDASMKSKIIGDTAPTAIPP